MTRPTSTTQPAQQYNRRDNKLHLNEIAIPTPKPNQLLVKVACASLCHTDLMLFEPNDQGAAIPEDAEPTTIGHEATGTVLEVGDGIAKELGFKEGDNVGFLPAIDCCYECEPCIKSHNLWCVKGTQKIQGFGSDGYFQPYVVVDARSAMVLPEGMDVRTSAPLFCAGVTAYHAVDDCGLKPGQWMAVIGCGGLGHLGIQYAKAMGYRVIGLDISTEQLEEAKSCGADYVFNSVTDPDYATKVMELTRGGVDAAVNFTASKQSYTDAPKIVRMGTGKLMVVGIPRKPIEFNALDIAMGKYKLLSSNNGIPQNMRPAIEFSHKHSIQPRVTFFKLEEVPEMVERMRQMKTRGRLGVQFD